MYQINRKIYRYLVQLQTLWKKKSRVHASFSIAGLNLNTTEQSKVFEFSEFMILGGFVFRAARVHGYFIKKKKKIGPGTRATMNFGGPVEPAGDLALTGIL